MEKVVHINESLLWLVFSALIGQMTQSGSSDCTGY